MNWGSGKGNHTPAHNEGDAVMVQTTANKEKILTNTQHEVMADLKKEA